MTSGKVSFVFQWRLAVGEEQDWGDPLQLAATDVGLSLATVKAVAVWLSTFMDSETGCTWVGIGHVQPGSRRKTSLAGRSSFDPRTVQRALRALEAAGFLEVTPGGGRGNTNDYQGVIPVRAAVRHLSRSDAETLPQRKGGGESGNGGGEDTKGGGESGNGGGGPPELAKEVVREVVTNTPAPETVFSEPFPDEVEDGDGKSATRRSQRSQRPSRAEMESWYSVESGGMLCLFCAAEVEASEGPFPLHPECARKLTDAGW